MLSMKKLLLTFAVLLNMVVLQAQSNQLSIGNTTAMVYALPKTELYFQITIETTVEKPGVFYLYSQRYLATDQVVMEEKQAANIVDIQVITQAAPDWNRRFVMEVPAKTQANYGVVVNRQGLLCGLNVPVKHLSDPAIETATKTTAIATSSELLPLTQEYMMAGSTAKLAEGAAKQIYTIRESRLNLLTGEVDHMPDGKALEMMLKELDAKEKLLTELFTGSVSKERKTYTVKYTPERSVENEVLFRLSSKRGLIDKHDLSGEPYYISIVPEKIEVQENGGKSEKIGIYTLIPARTQVRISNGKEDVYHQEIALPQFGQMIGLPETLLRTPKIKISIDPESGRLLSIEK